MPTITVPDATYERLSRHAARLGTTVEAVALPALDKVEEPPPAPIPPPALRKLSHEEFMALLDGITERARLRADRYPPGFECDVSRERIYEGCGE